MRKDLLEYDKEMLIGMLEDAAKLWLAHDGLWFLAVEKHMEMETAIELDKMAWGYFSPLEAQRIMNRIGLPRAGGVDALMAALNHRLYSHVNTQTIEQIGERTVVLRMNTCRVQAARERKGMELFPCREVGIVEYTTFAKTIDSRFSTRCLNCPPGPRPKSHYCSWEFTLKSE